MKFKQQYLPILLTIITFFVLSTILFFFIHVLNLFPTKDKIIVNLRLADVLIGLTIYLKTSIDFALFIGNQMKQNPGWKNRIAIEIGTALGNGLGTFVVLTLWTFFKEVPVLMVIMIFVAALVLFRMAEDSLEEYFTDKKKAGILFTFYSLLKKINTPFSPVIEKMLPHIKSTTNIKRSFVSLLLFAISIPFILGLDDFAGYIPLFSVVNVFGFAIGVFFGHMILNLLLFASPSVTIKIVKQPIIMIIGSLAFIGIGIWGLYEAGQILLHLFFA